MTTLPLSGGPTNKEIVDGAYLALGVSDALFGRTDEEYAGGVRLLRMLMQEWPFDQLGYDGASARPSERSGINAAYEQAVALCLAERIAPAIGKAMSPHAMKAKATSYSRLCAAAGVTPTMSFANGTPAGAGNRGSTFATWTLPAATESDDTVTGTPDLDGILNAGTTF